MKPVVVIDGCDTVSILITGVVFMAEMMGGFWPTYVRGSVVSLKFITVMPERPNEAGCVGTDPRIGRFGKIVLLLRNTTVIYTDGPTRVTVGLKGLYMPEAGGGIPLKNPGQDVWTVAADIVKPVCK
jgi:hypothetical protein